MRGAMHMAISSWNRSLHAYGTWICCGGEAALCTKGEEGGRGEILERSGVEAGEGMTHNSWCKQNPRDKDLQRMPYSTAASTTYMHASREAHNGLLLSQF